MAFKGITFAGQNVTPKNDGGLYQAHYGDGILWGCSMNISGDDLVIQSGEFIMGGRYVQVDGATPVDLSGRTLQTGYIQVIMNADLTQGEGLQWYTTFVESATTTFPALTKDDINNTGTLYQLELAVVQVSGGNLTAIYSTMGYSQIVSGSGASLNGTLDMTLPNGGYINFRDGNNALNARLGINTAGSVFLGHYASSVIANGLYAHNDGRAIIYGDGNDVCLRPNGSTSTTGEVKVDSTGQQIGGHPATNESLPSQKSVSVNTTTNLISVTGLNTSGVYIASGIIGFTPSSNTSATIVGALSISTSTLGGWRSFVDTNTTTLKYVSVCAVFTGTSQINLNVNSTVAGKAETSSLLRVVRLS